MLSESLRSKGVLCVLILVGLAAVSNGQYFDASQEYEQTWQVSYESPLADGSGSSEKMTFGLGNLGQGQMGSLAGLFNSFGNLLGGSRGARQNPMPNPAGSAMSGESSSRENGKAPGFTFPFQWPTGTPPQSLANGNGRSFGYNFTMPNFNLGRLFGLQNLFNNNNNIPGVPANPAAPPNAAAPSAPPAAPKTK